MSPAGLLFRNAVWRRLTESKPWEPRELRAGRGGRHRGPAKEDQELIGAQRASGVPQEKEEPDSEGRACPIPTFGPQTRQNPSRWMFA